MAGPNPDPLLDLNTRDGGAGADPYSPLTGGLDYSEEAERREHQQWRERRRASTDQFLNMLRRIKQQRERSEQAGGLQEELAAGQLLNQPDAGFGGLREAEQQMEAEKTPQTIPEAEALLEEQRAQVAAALERLNAYEQETANLDKTKFAPEIEQRFGLIKADRNRLESALTQLDDYEAEIERAKQEQEADPTVLQSALGMAADVDKALEGRPIAGAGYWGLKSAAGWIVDRLAGAQETLSGRVAMASGKLGITPEVGGDWSDILVPPLLGGLEVSEDDPRREQGRIHNARVARALGQAEETATDKLGFNPLSVMPGGKAIMLTEDVLADQLQMPKWRVREMRYQLAYEIATDPLNIVDAAAAPVTKGIGAGYRAAKYSEVGSRVIEKAPWLLKPERFWLRLSGEHEKAWALGNPEVEDWVTSQKAFRNRTDFEALKIRQEAAEEAARNLRQLSEQQQANVLGVVPRLVEKGGEARQAAKLGMGEISDPGFRQLTDLEKRVAIDYSDAYDRYAAQILDWERRMGLDVHDLMDDMDYLGREFSDDIKKLLAKDSTARREMFGTKGKRTSEELSYSTADPEQARKLRGMEFHEAEQYLRERFKLGDDVDIWRRDFLEQLGDRAQRSAYKAQRSNMAVDFASRFGRSPSDEVLDLALGMIDESGQARLAQAVSRLSDAEKRAVAVDAVREGFEEGRKAVRGAGRQAERQAGEAGLAGARAQEVRAVTGEAQAGSRSAYQLGRDAENRAVPVAEALKGEAEELVRATPGASEARQQLKDAQRLLRAAKDQEGLQKAAAAMAQMIGAERVTGAADDVVDAAQELVRYARKHIRDNPAIKDADQALRAANQMLADARQVAARVETNEIAGHLDDLLKSATAATELKGSGAKYLTHAMRKEVEKVKEVADEVADYYAKRSQGKAAKELDHEHRTVRDVRSAMSKMRAELRKDAPAALVREFDRIWRRAEDLAAKMEAVEGAVAKPVAAAVRKSQAEARKAARKALDDLENAPVSSLSPEAKAAWIQARMKEWGMGPAPGRSALDAMLDPRVKKAALPDDIDSLTRLALTELDPEDTRMFREFAEMTDRFADESKFSKYWQGIVRIFQRATLGRFGSLSKDAQGTFINGVVFGGTLPHLPEARKAVGGFRDWQRGTNTKTPDWALRLKAEGHLRTTMGEALSGPRVFEGVPVLGSVEKHGMLGAAAQAERKGMLGAPGRFVARRTDEINDMRVYLEEVNRAATYLKAIKQGASHEDAVVEMLKIWGNFSELSRLERKVLRKIILFWSWRVRSLGITVRHILDRPARSRWLLAMMAGDAGEDETSPDWLVRQGGHMLGLDSRGNAVALGLGQGSYMDPAIQTTQDLKDTFVALQQGEDWDQVLQKGAFAVGRQAVPPIQEGLAFMGGYDPFTGQPVRDERGRSNVKAPAAFVHLKDTAFGRLLNLREYEKDGETRQVFMDPGWATLFGMIPGMDPAMSDAAAFADPRARDVGDLSLGKGVLRSAGVPVYHFPPSSSRQRALREAKRKLETAVNKLPGHALTSSYGNVTYTDTTERGAQIVADRKRWESEAAQPQIGPTGNLTSAGQKRIRQYVDLKTAQKYPDEWQLVRLNRYISYQLKELEAERDGETTTLRLSKADLPGSGATTGKQRMERQDMAELARQRRRRRAALGFR